MAMTEELRFETGDTSWFTEARFGLFIHWGLYSLAARHEWVKSQERIPDEQYQKYFDHFYPDLYDPTEWALAAKNAGMKYFAITTKHHEGFCLFDSQYTDYKATNTPWGKDLIKPMVAAFREAGLRVGFYHSLLDWHHPQYPVDAHHPMRDNQEFRERAKGRDVAIYAEYLRNQVRELLTNYGKVDYLFYDFSFPGENGKGRKDWDSANLLKMTRELQPGIVVNDRLDLLDVPGGWDVRTPEQFMVREPVKVDGREVVWETCQTFSGSWGYHREEQTWKSVRQLLMLLINTVSKNGNLLLNVGPTARGTFDDRALRTLEGIGAWMRLHERAIAGCGAAPAEFATPENALLTYNAKTKRLYAHLLDYPMGELRLDGKAFAERVAYAQLLSDASELVPLRREAWQAAWEKQPEGGLTLRLPIVKPNVEIPVVELCLKD